MHTRDARGTTTLVWIDVEEAIIVRWEDRAEVERVRSGLAAHPPPAVPERADPHLRAFLADVAARVPETDDVRVVGPGAVRERLERTLRQDDRAHGRGRRVRSAASERVSERELVAHVRELVGDPEPNGLRGG